MTYLENLFFGASPQIQKRAGDLRKNMTLAEKVLWDKLKNKSVFPYKFRRQHPLNKYIVDFYCHRLRLAIEVDGSVHEIPENKEYDANRTIEINELGITVLRFSNEEVIHATQKVLDEIEYQIELLCPPKSPL